MCNQNRSSSWWLAALLGLLLLFVVRTLPAQEVPRSDISSSSVASMTSTPPGSATLSESMLSLQPQWLLFSERFQSFTGSLDQFLDQVEAFGISFEDLPLYLTFLTSSLENYSQAYREVQESMIATLALEEAKLAKEEARRIKAEHSRNFWRIVAVMAAALAAGGWVR